MTTSVSGGGGGLKVSFVSRRLILKVISSSDCLLSWLLSGGTSSPLTSGQQKVSTAFAGN